MEVVAAALRQRVAATEPLLRAVPDVEAARRPAADRWSKQEILGHLIDSACNNRQGFVRAQLDGALAFPGYEQAGWVRCQGYAAADWRVLVDLWSAYNRHLAEVIACLPAPALSVKCRIGGGEPVSLGWLVEDYLRHLDHHLAQLALPTPS